MPAHQRLSKRFLVCLIASICVLSGCANSQYTFFTAARASSCSSGGSGLASWTNPNNAISQSSTGTASLNFYIGGFSETLTCSNYALTQPLPPGHSIVGAKMSDRSRASTTGMNGYLRLQVNSSGIPSLEPGSGYEYPNVPLASAPLRESAGYDWLAWDLALIPFPPSSIPVITTDLVVTASRAGSVNVYNLTLIVVHRPNKCSSSPECVASSGCDFQTCSCNQDVGWKAASFPDCTPICGDGRVVGDEQCDSSTFGCAGCTCNNAIGMYLAEPAQPNCVSRCNDNILAPDEECEPSLASVAGSCGGDCHCNSTNGYQFIGGRCQAACGDGIVAGNEQCDGTPNCANCTCAVGYPPYNGLCVSCPAGTFINSGTNGECVQCPSGTRQDLPAASSCQVLYTCSGSSCSIGCTSSPSCTSYVNGSISFDSTNSSVTAVQVSGQVIVSGNLTTKGVTLTLSGGSQLTVNSCLNVQGALVIDLGGQTLSNGTVLASFDSRCSSVPDPTIKSARDLCTSGRSSIARSTDARTGRTSLSLIFEPPESLSECSSAQNQAATLNLPGIIAGVCVAVVVVVVVAVVFGVRPIREKIFPYQKRSAENQAVRLTTIQS